MYKVLIADDEDIIRHGLAQMVSRHPRLEVAALAEDGEMALEEALRVKPDLMLVDINMPFLNGLQLIGEIRKQFPNVLIIIITGYDDFEFVRKALQLGVTDYILKPVMEEPFYALLDKAISSLDGMQKSQKYLSWIQKQMEQNRPAMISTFFLRWLDGHLEETELQDRMEYLQLKIPEPFLLTILKLRDNHDLEHVQRGTDWDDNLLYFGCQNITQEVFAHWSETICFRTESGALAVISRELSQEQRESLREKLIPPLEEYLYVKVEITQAVGKNIMDFPQVFDLRQGCKDQLGILAAVSHGIHGSLENLRKVHNIFSHSLGDFHLHI